MLDFRNPVFLSQMSLRILSTKGILRELICMRHIEKFKGEKAGVL